MIELAEHVSEAEINELAKCLAFGRAAQDSLSPFLRIVNVGVSWCDIEVTEHDNVFVLLHLGFEEVVKRLQPVEFIRVLLGADLRPVRDVEIHHADVADRAGKYASLRVFKVRKVEDRIFRWRLADCCNTVIGLLPACDRMVAELQQRLGRKLLRHLLDFLQDENIGLMVLQPLYDVRFAHVH